MVLEQVQPLKLHIPVRLGWRRWLLCLWLQGRWRSTAVTEHPLPLLSPQLVSNSFSLSAQSLRPGWVPSIAPAVSPTLTRARVTSRQPRHSPGTSVWSGLMFMKGNAFGMAVGQPPS